MGHTRLSFLQNVSEGLRRAAPATALAIEIANTVPDSERIDTIPREPTEEEIRRFGDLRSAYQALWMINVKQHVADEGWGNAAKKYVLESSNFQEMDRRYHEAIGLRALFGAIADQNKAREEKNQSEIVLLLPHSPDLLGSIKLRISRSSKHSCIEPQGFLKAIIVDGELDRIRRCAYEQCGRFFWASRVDRPCCRESCRNAYRQKRHRERERQNRLSKKALKRSKGK